MPYIGKQLVRGQNRKLDDISSSFNGATTTFNLTVAGDSVTPGSALQLFISIGGVLQNPNTDFTVAGNQITFSTAPGSGLSFFGYLQGDAVDFNTPADGSVTTAKLVSNLTINVADGSAATPSIQFNGSGTDTGFYSPAADEIAITEGGSEALRIDSSGRLLVGTSTSVSTNSSLQIRNDSDGECLEVFRSSADANNPSISLTKTRGTAASPAEVSSGDILGALRFRGYDGASYQTAALVAGEADGSWTDGGDTTDNPGRLVFSTTADGASSPTPNMKLDSDGNLTVANNLSTTNFALINENGFFQANRATSTNHCFEGKLSGTTTSLITAAGNAAFNGAVSKGSGSFKISHPLPVKTDTHYLYHSFVEGPQADLIYRGHVQLVNGTASVNIDEAARMTEGTFEALCTNVCCFTSNESDWTAVRGSVSGNILTIEAQDPASTADICWMVVGERKDQHMIDTDWTDANGRVITERLKSEVDSPVED